MPGRPKFDIDEETLLHFRSLGFSWKNIARLLLVSRWTIWRRVRELGIAKKTGFSDATDEQLDNIVRGFMSVQGSLVCYSMVRGHLREMGVNVQRDRIRVSMARVDPISCRLRWATVVSRRSYSVAGPNSLWHIDGHHSLMYMGLRHARRYRRVLASYLFPQMFYKQQKRNSGSFILRKCSEVLVAFSSTHRSWWGKCPCVGTYASFLRR